MIEERRPDVSTLFSRFNDVSVSRNPLSKSKIVKFVIIVAFVIFNCDLSDFPGSIYDTKTARRFDTIPDILRSLGHVNLILKIEIHQLVVAGTEGLT